MGKIPYPEGPGLGKSHNVGVENLKLARMIKEGKHPAKPKKLDEERERLWNEICKACWEIVPEKRLTAKKAIAELSRK